MVYKLTSRATLQSTAPHEAKRPRLQGQEEYGNIQLPIWRHCLQSGVHKESIKDPGGEVQGAPQTTLPIHAHIQQTGHNSTPNNFKIIGREEQGLARTIAEAIYIRVNNPTVNRNIVEYNLNHIWDRMILFNTHELKLDSSQNQLHIHNNGQT